MQHMKTIHSIMQHMNNIKLNLSAVKGWQNVLNYQLCSADVLRLAYNVLGGCPTNIKDVKG